jgi:hypothetical protein
MDTQQAFGLIEEAAQRSLTEDEVCELGDWARHTLETAPPLTRGPNGEACHPLTKFITTFTKRVRPTEHFHANFKMINPVVMPYVVKLFNPNFEIVAPIDGTATAKI